MTIREAAKVLSDRMGDRFFSPEPSFYPAESGQNDHNAISTISHDKTGKSETFSDMACGRWGHDCGSTRKAVRR